MISWYLPTIRGAFEFSVTATGLLDGEITGPDLTQRSVGTVSEFTTINETGSTTQYKQDYSTYGSTRVVAGEDPNTTYATSTASTNLDTVYSSSTAATLVEWTTTTSTFTEEFLASGTFIKTALTSGTTTYWTTNTTSASDPTFVFITSSITITNSTTAISSLRPQTLTTAIPIIISVNSDEEAVYSTVIANTYDTIYEAQYKPIRSPVQEVISTGNEYLIAMNTFLEADIAPVPINADQYTLGGTRLTLSAPVETVSVHIADSTNYQTLEVSLITTETPYHSIISGLITEPRSSFYTTAFPPQTQQLFGLGSSFSIVSTNTTQTIRQGYTIGHYGNTITQAGIAALKTSYTDVLQDGRTFSEITPALGNLLRRQTAKTFSLTSTTPVYVTESNVTAAGNSSFLKDLNNIVGLVASRNLDIFEDIRPRAIKYAASCKIVKPHGVVSGSQVGKSFSANAPSFSASVYAQASRRVDGDERGVSALWTILTSSNDSFTLSSDGMTYTVFDGSTATTSSASVAVFGEPQIAVVATNNVLGGRPEESATFYQFASPGVYSYGDGLLTTITGLATKIEPGDEQETYVPMWVNHLNHNGERLIVVDRNPIPPGAIS